MSKKNSKLIKIINSAIDFNVDSSKKFKKDEVEKILIILGVKNVNLVIVSNLESFKDTLK